VEGGGRCPIVPCVTISRGWGGGGVGSARSRGVVRLSEVMTWACRWLQCAALGDGRWQQSPDGLKGHDPQYWYPLSFDADGNVLPLEWVDSFTMVVDVTPAVALGDAVPAAKA
jgi:hypothetical protein